MPSCWILRRVALVRTDLSEDLSVSIVRVIIGELGTLAITSNERCEETQHMRTSVVSCG
jgi:hypothetical protein